MNEETVSASHFRVHFKEIANAVAGGGRAYTVSRHGLPMVVVVSCEDAEFLRKHKWGAEGPAQDDGPVEKLEDIVALSDPDELPLELLEQVYETTTGTTDFDIHSWRYRAYASISGRGGKKVRPPWGPSG